MKYREGTCAGWDREEHTAIIVKRSYSADYCHSCNQKRLRAKKKEETPSQSTGYQNYMMPARDRAQIKVAYRKQEAAKCQSIMFDMIWETRKDHRGVRRSAVSGEPLHDFLKQNGMRGSMWYSQFFHILPKSTYPGLKCAERNLLLTTVAEHNQWHTQRHKCAEDPAWDFVFKRYQELQLEDSLANKVG